MELIYISSLQRELLLENTPIEVGNNVILALHKFMSSDSVLENKFFSQKVCYITK